MYLPVYIAVLICGFLVQHPVDLLKVGLGFLFPAQVLKTVVVAIWGEPYSHDVLVSDIDFWIGSLVVSGFWIVLITFVWGSRWCIGRVRGV